MTTKEQMNTEVPRIKRDGGKMPILGLGTFETSGETCRQAVKTALHLGYRHIDTARMYKNEAEVGTAIREAHVDRDELFVTTKLEMSALDPDGVRTSCDRSLRDLGLDYVDLLLIHWPQEDLPLADILGTMAELKSKGKIRHLGVSNFTVEWMEHAVEISQEPIFCNQIEFHPYIKQGPPLRFCREHDIIVVAYSPLARGRVADDKRLAEIGRKHGKTAAQVALRWIIRQNGFAAIPKGSSESHIEENLDIFDFELDDDDLKAIGSLEHDQRLIDPNWAPEWDT